MIVAVAAQEGVLAGAAIQPVQARAAFQAVVAITAFEAVVATADGEQGVIAAQALKQVVAVAVVEGVVPVGGGGGADLDVVEEVVAFLDAGGGRVRVDGGEVANEGERDFGRGGGLAGVEGDTQLAALPAFDARTAAAGGDVEIPAAIGQGEEGVGDAMLLVLPGAGGELQPVLAVRYARFALGLDAREQDRARPSVSRIVSRPSLANRR